MPILEGRLGATITVTSLHIHAGFNMWFCLATMRRIKSPAAFQNNRRRCTADGHAIGLGLHAQIDLDSLQAQKQAAAPASYRAWS